MSIIDTIQAKINNADSNTSVSDLLALLHAAKEYPIKSVYDSAGLMPTIDSADIGRIAFAENNNGMYVLVGLDSGWQLIDSDAASPDPVSGPLSIAQGTVDGYLVGGENDPSNPGENVTIQKFAFASDGNASDVGDLAVGQSGVGGHDGTTALQMGGKLGQPTYAMTNAVQTWTFASGTDAAQSPYTLGIQANYAAAGIQQTPSHAFVSGGYRTPPFAVYAALNKFAFANDANATQIANNDFQLAFAASASMSETHGYFAGSYAPLSPAPTDTSVLNKFPFATTDGATTDIGDLISISPNQNYFTHGNTGPTHGYSCGGNTGSNVIQKYSFSSDGNATDVGDLAVARSRGTGNQNPTHGYSSTGYSSGSSNNSIEKFTFATDANSTDVGDAVNNATFSVGVQI